MGNHYFNLHKLLLEITFHKYTILYFKSEGKFLLNIFA